jgi:hypothetical protein
MPPPGWPQLLLEGGFVPTAPVQAGGTFLLTDPVNGKLGNNTLGGSDTWSDLSAWMRNGTITRPSNREQGPLYNYPPGSLTVTMNNKDGRWDPDNLGGPYVAAGQTELHAMVPVRMRAVWGGVSYPLFAGFVQSWDDNGQNYAGHYAETTIAANDAQYVLAGIFLSTLTTPAGSGELTGSRVDRILTACGWYTGSGKRILYPGESQLQATTYNDYAWNLMQVAADSELGELYIGPAGEVVFRDRHGTITDTRSAQVQGVFGDSIGTAEPHGTELPYRSITKVRDDATIANDVQATIVGGSTMVEAFDQTSINTYLFARTYQRTDLILQNNSDALSWGQWIVYVGKTDEDRFDQIVITPQRDPVRLWPQVLGRQLGDRIQVWRRPPGVLPTATPWSYTNQGTPSGYYFIVTTAQAATITVGDGFRLFTSGGALKENTQFTVTSLSAPFAGFVNVSFTPRSAVLPTSGDIATQHTGAVIKDCFIRGITHQFDLAAATWQTTWTLQSADRYGSFFILDNPTTGQLDHNALAW